MMEFLAVNYFCKKLNVCEGFKYVSLLSSAILFENILIPLINADPKRLKPVGFRQVTDETFQKYVLNHLSLIVLVKLTNHDISNVE